MFRITNIKTPPSFEPTIDSIIYEVFTTSGNLIEELLEGYPIVNTEPGELSPYKNGLLPDEFQANYETNYTLEVYFVNYKQNLDILLTLPEEINFGTDAVYCEGLAGTDRNGENITCIEDREAKTINITDALTFTRGNPGAVRIVLSKLKNPTENIITSSFKIETFTPDGWVLDEVTTNVTVNFYCAYPCASCNIDDPE